RNCWRGGPVRRWSSSRRRWAACQVPAATPRSSIIMSVRWRRRYQPHRTERHVGRHSRIRGTAARGSCCLHRHSHLVRAPGAAAERGLRGSGAGTGFGVGRHGGRGRGTRGSERRRLCLYAHFHCGGRLAADGEPRLGPQRAAGGVHWRPLCLCHRSNGARRRPLAAGREHVKKMLVGGILSVTADELLRFVVLYSVIGAVHWIIRRPLLAAADNDDGRKNAGRYLVWDLVFYLSFGLVVTS